MKMQLDGEQEERFHKKEKGSDLTNQQGFVLSQDQTPRYFDNIFNSFGRIWWKR